MQVETDLPIVSGTPFLELGPGQNTPYVLSVSPWKQGKQTGVFILLHFCVKCTNHFLLVYSNAAVETLSFHVHITYVGFEHLVYACSSARF